MNPAADRVESPLLGGGHLAESWDRATNVLVTGGAGYIGSHAVRRLVQDGHRVVCLDNLVRGHRAAVHPDAVFVLGDVRDADLVTGVLENEAIDTVMHFAGLTYVSESVTEPLDYYAANAGGSLALLRAMARVGVPRLVFSSTAAVYGEPEQVPIRETAPLRPLNPYGRSKHFVEQILADHAAADGTFSYAVLRYFNVAGCARDGSLGEDHRPEPHIVPVLLQAALGERRQVIVHGTDWPTPDGTCIRDYLHVEDLVDAHIHVLHALQGGTSRVYNLGIGRGHSVREVLDAARRVTGRPIAAIDGPRRPGDPAVLYADPSKIHLELGWRARLTDLDEMVDTAWRWLRDHPHGYEDE